MVTYVKTMLGAKLGQKGALFVEYALILAFVLVVGVVFLNDNGLSAAINTIFGKATGTLNSAATSVPDVKGAVKPQ